MTASIRYWVLGLSFLALMTAQTFEDARRLHLQGRWVEAEQAYRAVLKRSGPAAEILANLGAVLVHEDKFVQAISAYQQALNLAPSLAPIHLNLGLAYLKSGKFEDASRELTAFLKVEPAHPQARQLRAMAALELERYEDAVRDYSSLMPSEDLSVRLGLATALTRLGRTSEAREVLGRALENESSAEVQFVRGQALLEDGQLDEALAALETARRLNPNLPQLRMQIGAVQWRRKDTEAALTLWREEWKANPSSFSANYTLGAALALSQQNRTEAEGLLRTAVRLKPGHAGAAYHLGKLLWQKSRSPEAVGLLERAAKADSGSREVHYLLATAYQSLGRKVEAAREFARVKELSEKELRRSRDLFETSQ
jgi:tetratricopeptide (TPR) repeat protein